MRILQVLCCLSLALSLSLVRGDAQPLPSAPKTKVAQEAAAEKLSDEITKGLRSEEAIKKRPDARLEDAPNAPGALKQTVYCIGQPNDFWLYYYHEGRLRSVDHRQRRTAKEAYDDLNKLRQRLGEPKKLSVNKENAPSRHYAHWSYFNGFLTVTLGALRIGGTEDCDMCLHLGLP